MLIKTCINSLTILIINLNSRSAKKHRLNLLLKDLVIKIGNQANEQCPKIGKENQKKKMNM